MEIETHWHIVKTIFKNSFSFHYSIASVDENCNPHVTPIGSLILGEPPTSQRVVISLLRQLLPPHADNEKAADFLRLKIGQNHKLIEWAAVRPDSLSDNEDVTKYDLFISPTRNAIFDSAPSSRINVTNFMARLMCEDELWNEWKGKMPVIYNHV